MCLETVNVFVMMIVRQVFIDTSWIKSQVPDVKQYKLLCSFGILKTLIINELHMSAWNKQDINILSDPTYIVWSV